MYGWQRSMRIFDGPDEVHFRTIAKAELGREPGPLAAAAMKGELPGGLGPRRLSGAWNFRDVAETAGLRPGRLFRSSELSNLDDAGRQALADLGITDVADLRSPAELARRGGGAVPEDVAVHNLRSRRCHTPTTATPRRRTSPAGTR